MGCDLILAVDFRSDGAGGFWAHGRRWAAAGDSVRGGGVRSSPVFAKTAVWGSKQVELWPGMVSAIRVNHLSPERGTGVRGAELATAAAALDAGNSPECGVPATGVA